MAHPTYEKVKAWMDSEGIRDMVASSLGKTQEVNAWINAALASIGTDKDVLEATPESILGSFLEAASLGLRFEGPLGEAYISTRSKKVRGADGQWAWFTEAQLQIGYRGLMKLARRDPRVRKVEAIIVHENDTFQHQLGTNQFLNHTWEVGKPRGRMVAVYAAVRYHDGFYDFGQPYSMEAVMKHRDNILADKSIRIAVDSEGRETFFKRYDSKETQMTPEQTRKMPWIAYIEAMVQKTAVRWSAKFWDLTPDFDRATALISIDESGRSQQLEELARKLIPVEIINPTQPTTGTPGNATQTVSLTRMGSLKDQMMREAGIKREVPADGPPPENAQDAPGTATPSMGSEAQPEGERPEEQPGNEVPGQPGEMTEDEKQEALRVEVEEAEAFRLEEEAAMRNAGTKTENKPARGNRRETNGAK